PLALFHAAHVCALATDPRLPHWPGVSRRRRHARRVHGAGPVRPAGHRGLALPPSPGCRREAAVVKASSAALPRTYWWLCAVLLAMAGAVLVLPFLALPLARQGFWVATAGRVIPFFGLGALPAGPIAGLAADRLGRKPALVGALVLAAMLAALLPWLSGL